MDLVCSICGSDCWYDQQQSMDPRWSLGRCGTHGDPKKAKPLIPLVSRDQFQAKRSRPRDASPEDLFGTLNEDERAALRAAVKVTSLTDA